MRPLFFVSGTLRARVVAFGRGARHTSRIMRMKRFCGAVLVLVAPLLALPAGADTPGIAFSGDARIGVVRDGGQNALGRESGLRLTARARLRLHLRGQTDGGLHFGADLPLEPGRGRFRGGAASVGARGGAFGQGD